jgi:hypothetical protein
MKWYGTFLSQAIHDKVQVVGMKILSSETWLHEAQQNVLPSSSGHMKSCMDWHYQYGGSRFLYIPEDCDLNTRHCEHPQSAPDIQYYRKPINMSPADNTNTHFDVKVRFP